MRTSPILLIHFSSLNLHALHRDTVVMTTRQTMCSPTRAQSTRPASSKINVCVCVCVCVCQRQTKDRADGMSEKVPIPLDGIRTCTSGIRAICPSDNTKRAGMPRVSSNKHYRHSPTSSIVKCGCLHGCFHHRLGWVSSTRSSDKTPWCHSD